MKTPSPFLGTISRCGAPWLVALLIATTFAPLILGYRFLPFGRYPTYTRGMLASAGVSPEFDSRFLERYTEHPWLYDADPSWFTLLLPQSLYAATELRHGRFPLWDPYSGCGVPTFGTGYFRPFDPFKIPFYLSPGTWTYSLALLLSLLFGAWGMARWLREERLSPEGRAIGTTVFALNPWVLERIVLQDASAYLILPWCLLALGRVRWEDRRSVAVAALTLVLLGHVGHAEACLVLAVVAGLWALARKESPVPRGRRFAVLSAVALAVVAALALLWIPPLEVFRLGFSYKKATMIWEYPYAWKSLLTPVSDLYLLPALAGLVVAGAGWGRRRGFWVATAAISVLLILPIPGLGHVPAELLQRYLGVPVFYLKPVLWVSMALLAAQGWDARSQGGFSRIATTTAVGLALLVAGGAYLILASPLPVGEIVPLPGLLLPLTAAGVGILLLDPSRLSPAGRSGGILLMLAPLAFPIPLSHLEWNRVRVNPRAIASEMPKEESSSRSVSIGFRPSFALPPNWGQALGVRMGELNAVLFPNRFLELYGNRRFPPTLVVFDSPAFEAFRQLGASRVLLPNDLPFPGIRLLSRGAWASAYEVPGASGRLYFARAVATREMGSDLSKQIMDLGQGSDAVAVLDNPGSHLPPNIPAPSPPGATVRFEKDAIHEVICATSNPGTGLLVLKDTWFPGWRATVDGSPAEILRVNGCFRGVALPPGDHRVRFTYRPFWTYLAAGISVSATLLLAWFSLRKARSGMDFGAGGP